MPDGQGDLHIWSAPHFRAFLAGLDGKEGVCVSGFR